MKSRRRVERLRCDLAATQDALERTRRPPGVILPDPIRQKLVRLLIELHDDEKHPDAHELLSWATLA
ncbi:hypothetical protein [Thiocystis violascens]|nr:hypothetical protein [Thiocystis violascens]